MSLSRLIAPVVLGTLLLGAAVAAQNNPTPAAGARTLAVATLAPAGSTWMRGLDAANRELRRRSNGALSLRFYAGGVQGDESEMVRKMRQGRLDGAVMTGVGLGQIHRPVLAFMLPGMFSDQAALERSRSALTAEVTQQFAAANFVLASWGTSGAPRLFSRLEIHTPADLARAKPWRWRDDVILPAFYTEAGARGVELALPEVLGALQTGRIDTFVAPPYAAVALQWSSQVQFVSEGVNSYSVGGIVFRKPAIDSLPADQQTTLREVIQQFSGLTNRNIARDDENAVRTMTTRGVRLVEYTAAQRTEWTALFGRARQRLVGTISDAAWMERVRAGR
jgi:TRAP-type C4-dicarboxylate transport system substrate-binding protein